MLQNRRSAGTRERDSTSPRTSVSSTINCISSRRFCEVSVSSAKTLRPRRLWADHRETDQWPRLLLRSEGFEQACWRHDRECSPGWWPRAPRSSPRICGECCQESIREHAHGRPSVATWCRSQFRAFGIGARPSGAFGVCADRPRLPRKWSDSGAPGTRAPTSRLQSCWRSRCESHAASRWHRPAFPSAETVAMRICSDLGTRNCPLKELHRFLQSCLGKSSIRRRHAERLQRSLLSCYLVVDFSHGLRRPCLTGVVAQQVDDVSHQCGITASVSKCSWHRAKHSFLGGGRLGKGRYRRAASVSVRYCNIAVRQVDAVLAGNAFATVSVEHNKTNLQMQVLQHCASPSSVLHSYTCRSWSALPGSSTPCRTAERAIQQASS